MARRKRVVSSLSSLPGPRPSSLFSRLTGSFGSVGALFKKPSEKSSAMCSNLVQMRSSDRREPERLNGRERDCDGSSVGVPSLLLNVS